MRYTNCEYRCRRSTKVVLVVVLVVVGLLLFAVGAYFGSHYLVKGKESGILYRKALAERMSISTRMSETQDNSTASQALDHELDQINEVVINAVRQRNSLDSAGNRFGFLAFFGACMVVTPVLFFLIRLPKKLFRLYSGD